MIIPLVDLKAQYQTLRDELLPVVEHTISQCQYILGQEVELFEKEFAAFCGVKHCVGVSSGTDALHLALRALEIGPGDEVITAANTFIATAFAISYTGATPVLVDVSPMDYNIEPEHILEAITEQTKAIIPVHLYGQPADMNTIMDIARQYNLYVVEDACQAHGARSNGRRAGSFGNAACFSFYPGKNLGAFGDGGAVVTDDEKLAEIIREFRQYGQKEKYIHTGIGFNCRLDALQAAILRVKLRFLDEWNEQRRNASKIYRKLLANNDVILPTEKSDVHHVYHLFVIQHDQRDKLLDYLKQKGIFCGIHYPIPISHQKPFLNAKVHPNGSPISTELSKSIISLPIFPEISEEQIEYISREIKKFQNK